MSVRFKAGPGNDRTFGRLELLAEGTRRALRQAWFQVGRDLSAEANRQVLKTVKTGRTYVVRGPSGRRRRHVASAPGQSHANLTGKLRKSVSWKIRGERGGEFGYGVSTTDANRAPEYAPAVEFGTSKMAARPTLQNTIRAVQGKIGQHLRDAVEDELS